MALCVQPAVALVPEDGPVWSLPPCHQPSSSGAVPRIFQTCPGKQLCVWQRGLGLCAVILSASGVHSTQPGFWQLWDQPPLRLPCLWHMRSGLHQSPRTEVMSLQQTEREKHIRTEREKDRERERQQKEIESREKKATEWEEKTHMGGVRMTQSPDSQGTRDRGGHAGRRQDRRR